MAEAEPAASEPPGGHSLPGFPALPAPKAPTVQTPAFPSRPGRRAGERPPAGAHAHTRTRAHPATRARAHALGALPAGLSRAARAPQARARGGCAHKGARADRVLCGEWAGSLRAEPWTPRPLRSVRAPLRRPPGSPKPSVTALPTGPAKRPFRSGLNTRAQRRAPVGEAALVSEGCAQGRF